MITFGKLNKIWKAKSLSRRTKKALYQAIILSVMLYNAEVWPIKKQDMKALEGAHFTMMRRMIAGNTTDKHISREELLSAFELPPMSDFITQKRMRWVGHALRRPDGDGSKIAVTVALQDKDAYWTGLVRKDCTKLNISFNNLKKLVKDRSDWRNTTFMSPRTRQSAGYNNQSRSESRNESRRSS
jgi:hypothetical protein